MIRLSEDTTTFFDVISKEIEEIVKFLTWLCDETLRYFMWCKYVQRYIWQILMSLFAQFC